MFLTRDDLGPPPVTVTWVTSFVHAWVGTLSPGYNPEEDSLSVHSYPYIQLPDAQAGSCRLLTGPRVCCDSLVVL